MESKVKITRLKEQVWEERKDGNVGGWKCAAVVLLL